MTDAFWGIIDSQIKELRNAKGADDVMAILSTDGRKATSGFFGGSGGDESVIAALLDAGWFTVWVEADYYWGMTAPDGSAIHYVEGDVFRGVGSPLPHNETAIEVVVIGTDDTIEITKVTPDLETFQALVHGSIEAIRGDGWSAYIHSEGKDEELPVNMTADIFARVLGGWRHIPGDFLVGAVVFLGEPDDEGNDTAASESTVRAAKRFQRNAS